MPDFTLKTFLSKMLVETEGAKNAQIIFQMLLLQFLYYKGPILLFFTKLFTGKLLLPSLVGTLQKHAFWKHKLQSSAGLILPDCMPRIRSKFNMRNRKWQALSLPNCCLKSHDWLRCVKFWQSSPAAWPPREIQITQQQRHIPTNRWKMFGAQKNELENKHK